MKPEFTKGGRGKVAPYQTTHLRIPEELAPYVRRLVDDYKLAVADNRDRQFIDKLLNPVNRNNNKLIEAEELAEKIQKTRSQKKRSTELLESLLNLLISR